MEECTGKTQISNHGTHEKHGKKRNLKVAVFVANRFEPI